MNDYIDVIAIVEGRTEQTFIERVLAPYLAKKNIFMRATQISKPGQKGGDVKFIRAERDIGKFLKQRADTYVTQFFDYYGLKEWPNLSAITTQNHIEIAKILNDGAVEQIKINYKNFDAERRFIPYMAMHEFETLLFSDETILADSLNVSSEYVIAIVEECGEPEKINNSRETAPSKRLDNLIKGGKFKKLVNGIIIAEQIGIDKMRTRCPLFNEWLNKIEARMCSNC